MSDKYRWHDLTKDPKDLPTAMPVLVWYDNTRNGAKYKGCAIAESKWRDGYGQSIGNVIAWRDIEPFEEEEDE